jgi:hypothetical protein
MTRGANGVEPARNKKNANDWPQQSAEWRQHEEKWPQHESERSIVARQSATQPGVLRYAEPTNSDEVDEMLKSLRLPTFRRHLHSLIEERKKHQHSYRSFLAMLCAREESSG